MHGCLTPRTPCPPSFTPPHPSRPWRKIRSRVFPSLLACVLACVAATLAHAAERTRFVLVDPTQAWRATQVGKATAANLIIDQIIQPATGRSRILIVSARVVDDPPDSLDKFAQAIKRTLAAGAGPDTLDLKTDRLGFTGHELHFSLTRDGDSFDCELFVFADGIAPRGILCAADHNDPAAAYSLLARLQRPAPALAATARPDGVVALAPLKVRDNAVSDYSISFRIIGSREHHRVVKLIVTDLDPTSTPSSVEIGDEITAINGRPVQEFDSSVGRNTELGRIFLNCHLGDSVTLDLVSAHNREPYTVTLRIEDFHQWLKRGH